MPFDNAIIKLLEEGANENLPNQLLSSQNIWDFDKVDCLVSYLPYVFKLYF